VQTLYKYLQFVEAKFRAFLSDMSKRVEEGSFVLEEIDTTPSPTKMKEMQGLMENMEKRLVTLPFEK
jgi:hypothetical protein